MNPSVADSNLTTGVPRDSPSTAIVKNMITAILSIFNIIFNGMLIHTFRQHQVLNTNPRYILYIHLVINDIILVFIFAFLLVLSYAFYTFNVTFCMFLVVTGVLSNMNNPLTLAAMALECYVAICFPLHHVRICTVKNTYVVLGLVWVISSLVILPDIFVVLVTESLDFFQSRIFCLKDHLFRSQLMKEKREISYIILLVLICLTLVFAYFNILFAAQVATANARKARNTVLLHGFQLSLCMLTYTYNHMTNALIAQFPKQVTDIRFTNIIILQVLPRLVSPLVYGLRDKTFRKYLMKSLCNGGKDEDRTVRG